MPQSLSYDSGLAWDDLTPGIAWDGFVTTISTETPYGLRQPHLVANEVAW
jgi:hypothetical protein